MLPTSRHHLTTECQDHAEYTTDHFHHGLSFLIQKTPAQNHRTTLDLETDNSC